jgi:hypothetical protein
MATNYTLKFSGNEIDNLLTKVQNLPEDISTLKFSIANELPTEDIDLSTIYLVKTANEDYEEYIYINNNWEMLGTTKVDLTDYVTTNELNNDIILYEDNCYIPRSVKEVFDNWTFTRMSDNDANENTTVDLTTLFEHMYTMTTQIIPEQVVTNTQQQYSHYTFKANSFTAADGTSYTSLTDISKLFANSLNFIDYKNMKIRIAGGSPIMQQVYCYIGSATVIFMLLKTTSKIVAQSFHNEGNYANKDYVDTKIQEIEIPSIEGLATETFVNEAIQNKTDKTYVDTELAKKANKTEIPNLTNYATKEYVDEKISDSASVWLGTQEEYESIEHNNETLYVIKPAPSFDFSGLTITLDIPNNLGNSETKNLRPGQAYDYEPVFTTTGGYEIVYNKACNETTEAKYFKLYEANHPMDNFYYWHSTTGTQENLRTYTCPNDFGEIDEIYDAEIFSYFNFPTEGVESLAVMKIDEQVDKKYVDNAINTAIKQVLGGNY